MKIPTKTIQSEILRMHLRPFQQPAIITSMNFNMGNRWKSCTFDSQLKMVDTHHAFVRFLSRVNPHMDEQLVAGVEGFVAPHTSGPKAGEILALALVDVDLLDMPNQLLLLLICCAAVNPSAYLLIAKYILPVAHLLFDQACGFKLCQQA